MKYILAIQTAEFPNSIALADEGGNLIEEKIIESKGRTEEVLGILTQDILKGNKVSFKELITIAISIGPGSYTGLRVGLAFAKGIVQFGKINLIGIDSIEAIKQGNKTVIPLLDARNERVYYKKGKEIKVDDIKTAFKDLDISNDDLLVGTGAIANRDYLVEMLGKDNVDVDSNIHKLTAENIAKIAAEKADAGQSVFEIKPIYVQEARITVSKKLKIKN